MVDEKQNEEKLIDEMAKPDLRLPYAVAQDLVDFLGSQPYVKVFRLITVIGKLKPIDEPQEPVK